MELKGKCHNELSGSDNLKSRFPVWGYRVGTKSFLCEHVLVYHPGQQIPSDSHFSAAAVLSSLSGKPISSYSYLQCLY